MMRYARIEEMETVNGVGVGVSLFTQGCRFHCKNCFNKELWDYSGGKQWDENALNDVLKFASKEYITRLSILGGEPLSLENIDDLTELLKTFKKYYPNKQIWLYSGHTYDIISLELLKYVDIFVDGLYIEELGDYRLKFRGSSNQRIIDVQKTLVNGKVVLWEEGN